jgi:hypothetical protein
MLCTLCSVAAMSAAARAMDRTTTGRISLLDFSEHVAPRAAGAGAGAGGREQQRVGVGAISQTGSTPECTISTTAASLLLRGQVDPLYADTVSGALLLHTLLLHTLLLHTLLLHTLLLHTLLLHTLLAS